MRSAEPQLADDRLSALGPSARKHGISGPVILCAPEHWADASDPDDDMHAKQVVSGFDRIGRLLELAILTLDSGHQLVFHATKVRRKYLHLLE